MPDRVDRPCDVCGQVDSDPRIVTGIHDPTQSGYVHFDCSDSYQHHQIIEAAGGNREKLVSHLEQLSVSLDRERQSV